MKEISSPYYPQRARWYNRFRYPWFEFKRLLHIESLRLPTGIPLWNLFLSLALPGQAFSAFGWKMIGRWILIGYCLAGLIFIAFIGHRIASLALGFMMSVHVTSITYLAGRWLDAASLQARAATALGAMLALHSFVYSPLHQWVQKNWALPLQVGDQVIVVQPGTTPKSIRQGNVVAYHLSGFRTEGLYIHEGVGLDMVLAVAGDYVRFQSNCVQVNGKALLRHPHMPVQGEILVPEKNWLIWPTLSINNGNNQSEANISSAMLQAAMIAETQYIGKPYRHWFGRCQFLP